MEGFTSIIEVSGGKVWHISPAVMKWLERERRGTWTLKKKKKKRLEGRFG